MKYLITSLFILFITNSTIAQNAFPKYKKIDKTFGQSLPLDAAKIVEEKYILPSYPLAKKAYSELLAISKRKNLSEKDQEKINNLKQIIMDYSLWVKLSKLYLKAHYSYLLSSYSVNYDKLGRDASKDATSKGAKSEMLMANKVYNQSNSAIRFFFKENQHLTKTKGFVNPTVAVVRMNKVYEQKVLSAREREVCQTLLAQQK